MLDPFRATEYSLTNLVEAARSLIEQVPAAPSDGRVAEFPDARTIRYYQTIGIVDKPLRYEGRNAVYGYQHLLQVVAIKLLQSRGLTLAQVQRAITNATLSDLETALTDELVEVRVIQEQIKRPAPKRTPTARKFMSDYLANGHIPLEREYLPAEELPSEGRSRGLIAAEVAPGVSVIIDPDEVDDPEGVIAWIIRLLNTITGGLK
jgi:DNA-binding transcriptional MerR regulator